MKCINYHDIINRKCSMNENNNTSIDENCDLYFDRYDKDPTYRNLVNFVNECTKSTVSSNKYFREIMDIYKNIDDNNIRYRIETSIVPKFNDSNIIVESTKINDIINNNHICDRILENHNKISEKYPIEKFASSITSPELLIYKCCECTDQFKLVNRGKVIIALEEFFYLANKNQIDYNDQSIVESAISYYLIKHGNTMDYNKLDTALKKNVVLEYDADYSAPNPIEYFKISIEKNSDLLLKTVTDIFDDMDSYDSIHRDIAELFNLFRSIIISSDDDELVSSVYNIAIPAIYTTFYNKFMNNVNVKNYIEFILKELEDEVIASNTYIKNYSNDEIISRFTHYLSAIKDCIEKFKPLYDLAYRSYNIENMIYSSVSEAKKPIIFKQQNLVNVITKIDKFLSNKFKNIKIGIKDKIKNLKNKLFLSESTDFYSLLDENGFIDVVYEAYEIKNPDAEFNDTIESICKEINERYLRGTEYSMYYVTLEDSLELHIKSKYCYIEEQDIEKLEHSLSEYEMSCLYDLEQIKEVTVPEFDDIVNYFDTYQEDAHEEYFDVFVELASYAGIDKDTMFKICSLTGNNIARYNPIEAPINIQLEAVDLISSIIYEDTKTTEKKPDQKDDKKQTSEDGKPGPITGVNLNNIKLGLQGLKKMMKDMNAKQQNISRQADTQFNMFIRSMQKALISDRREAIIKGSVIPSFSRCIKIGLALTLLGIATKGFLAPAIAAIGAFGVSKKLTKKERTLLLDDIETELEVLEKEIQIADSKNQMKKLRALMRTKKDLQRQYQRIKYNTRIGKDLLPSSTGVGRE